MQQRILAWVSVLLGGVIVIALVSVFVVSRSVVRQRSDPALATPLPMDTAPIAGLPGTSMPVALETGDTAPPPVESTPGSDRFGNRIIPNVGPVDSVMMALEPGARQHAALDKALRRGIVYQVKEQTPDVIRFVIGAPFFAEPMKYRNPLVRDLYHAKVAGRPAGHPLYFEFWDLRQKLGEYVSDTFYLGPGYAKPR